MSSSQQYEYSSEGFDLDAMPTTTTTTNSSQEIIYELGGTAATATIPTSTNSTAATTTARGTTTTSTSNDSNNISDTDSPIFQSEQCKQKGNDFFKQRDYLNAYDMYSDAIDACPGMSGPDIIKLREEHEEKEREKANQRYLRDTDRRTSNKQRMNRYNTSHDKNIDTCTATTDSPKKNDNNNSNDHKESDELAPSEFQLPPHPYASYLSVYYCNRAACLLHEQRYADAILDCDIAILLDPNYTKAYIRRMTAYENTDQSELALRDAKQALSIDKNKNNKDIQKHVQRLQKVEDERMEKLKEETMGKLKDLGNSILGNFGLSLDNFKAQQDPNTGSYSISFNQN